MLYISALYILSVPRIKFFRKEKNKRGVFFDMIYARIDSNNSYKALRPQHDFNLKRVLVLAMISSLDPRFHFASAPRTSAQGFGLLHLHKYIVAATISILRRDTLSSHKSLKRSHSRGL